MAELTDEIFDLFIIGGGINGVGIARDAAGRGLKVALCEQGDIGQATSSATSKLIHGGIRYLEQYEFRLVRESLQEREVFLRIAPHLVRPLRFIMPHTSELRPLWQIRLGLFLYDHLGKRTSLPGSGRLALHRDISQCPLKPEYVTGFYYWDCAVDDSRLVILTAVDAQRHGAQICPRTRCIGVDTMPGNLWTVRLEGKDRTVRHLCARALINAAGPWANHVGEKVIGHKLSERFRLVQGSHIVVPQLYLGNDAYILQNPDRRIVFAMPFTTKFTLIGTTDTDYLGDPSDARITPEETDYLVASVNRYFSKPTFKDDIVWSYSGVRPLYGAESGSASELSRDYRLDLIEIGGAPLLTPYGGKLTNHRALAERVMRLLSSRFGSIRGDWTARQPLPGGDPPAGDKIGYLNQTRQRYPWIEEPLAQRYVHCYGTLTDSLLENSRSVSDLGRYFGATLYEREVIHLWENEWARTCEDILWRRTKLGIDMAPSEVEALRSWLEDRSTRSKEAPVCNL